MKKWLSFLITAVLVLSCACWQPGTLAEEAEETARTSLWSTFESGYVYLPAGTKAYRSASMAAESGVFVEAGPVFARAQGSAWLTVAFVRPDTGEMTHTYVMRKSALELTDAEIKALKAQLNQEKAPFFIADRVPVANFVPADQYEAWRSQQAGGSAEQETEPADAEEVSEAFEEPEEQAAEAPSVSISVNMAEAAEGETVVFTVTVTGMDDSAAYQWQRARQNNYEDSGLSGAKTPSLYFAANEARLSFRYRCRVTWNGTEYYSEPATVAYAAQKAVSEAPADDAEAEEAEVPADNAEAEEAEAPADDGDAEADETEAYEEAAEPAEYLAAADAESVVKGKKVTFWALISGGPEGEAAFQWQKSADGETGWSASSQHGAKTAEMTLTATEELLNNWYRCRVTDAAGTHYTNAVRVALLPDPVVTASAVPAAAIKEQKVVFTAVPEGTVGEVSYQWQKSPDGESDWKKSRQSGNASAEMTLVASEELLDNWYRCAVKDDNGTWYSAPVKAELAPDPVVTASAVPAAAIKGQKVVFSAVPEGTAGEVSYQWQKSPDGESDWKKSRQSGNTTAEMILVASEELLGNWYRCAVKDDNGTWYSAPVKAELAPDPVVTASAVPAAAIKGQKVVFTAVHEGTVGEVSYQWQKSPDGESDWKKSRQSGNTTAEMTLVASEELLGNWYRCAVKDDNGTWYSAPVKAELAPDPVITAAADRKAAATGQKVKIAAVGAGVTGEVSYQWQKSPDGQTGWKNSRQSGNETAELTLTASAELLDGWYRCVVTDQNGAWPSAPVKVEWIPDPELTVTVSQETARKGDKVYFTLTAEGLTGAVTYQWQKSADGQTGWSSSKQKGAETAEMIISANADLLANWYRCRVTDENGTWYTDAVKVTYTEE